MLDFLAAATKAKGSNYTFFIILIVAYGLVYWFYLRPRMKRTRAQRAEGTKFEVGDRVRTIGGLIGRVVEHRGSTVVIEGVDGTQHEYMKEAIHSKFDPVVTTDDGMEIHENPSITPDSSTDEGGQS